MTQGESDEASAFINTLSVSREDLVPAYKAMLALSMKEQSFLDFDSYALAVNQFTKADKGRIRCALRVFSELGLIRVVKTGGFRVEVVPNAPKREITESETFRFAQSAPEAYGQWCSAKQSERTGWSSDFSQDSGEVWVAAPQ